MIEYANTKPGDILRIVGVGAPGYAKNGELVRVTKTYKDGVAVENKDGEPCEFVFNCGAARLEATEWRDDFPSDAITETCETETDLLQPH